MEKKEEEKNWSERVEDIISSGEINSAISFLETLISNLNSQPQIASALLQLSNLYSINGFSLKSDEARSRATAINIRLQTPSTQICDGEKSRVSHFDVDDNNDDDDDWEAIADRAPEELLPLHNLPQVSNLSLNEAEVKTPKRRGRGSFMFKKRGLYSDQLDGDGDGDDVAYDDSFVEVVDDEADNNLVANNSLYGSHHALVLDGFHPSTTTTDLERLFEDFRDRGFVIRWVNDTLALAVFRSPSLAKEACNSVHCSFSVRVLEEDDPLTSSISIKDLDPPRQRPKTSAQTAQRLIAQELGVKLPSTFGSRELRKQEDARRNRIVTRQTLRDEAWGPDDIK